MTVLFRIHRTSNAKRQAVQDWLFGLDRRSPSPSENDVTTWTSSWASSPYERLDDMPFGSGCDYPVNRHRGGSPIGTGVPLVGV